MTVHIPVDMHRFFLVVIDYSYDSLSRLLQADYNNGATVYNYGYDLAGNMVDYDGVNRTYNAANQMTNDGTNTLVYDNNGNLRTLGSDTYTWDRANRLLSVGNHSYVYDGLGNRVQQTVSSVVTDYLNDVQPGLTKLLAQSTGATVDRFVHSVRGIHAVDDGTDWNFYSQDGLGSVRALTDANAVVQTSMSFDPYGNFIGTPPTSSYIGFTGEQTDANGSVFLRARYYEPSLGMFSALDPFEGKSCTPMSLNGYSWVHGNPIMNTDPSGNIVRLEDITEEQRARYSCKCGWLDFTHVIRGIESAILLLGALSEPINYSEYESIARVLRLQRELYGTPIGPINSNLWAFVPEHLVSTDDGLKSTALGIFMKYEESIENVQRIGNWVGNSRSGFAEEDLPSDWIGFWLGARQWLENDLTLPTRAASTYQQLMTSLGSTCGVMTQDQSVHMYEQYQDNGGMRVGWREWERRPRPLDTTLPDENQCPNGEGWPDELAMTPYQPVATSPVHGDPMSSWSIGSGVYFIPFTSLGEYSSEALNVNLYGFRQRRFGSISPKQAVMSIYTGEMC